MLVQDQATKEKILKKTVELLLGKLKIFVVERRNDQECLM